MKCFAVTIVFLELFLGNAVIAPPPTSTVKPKQETGEDASIAPLGVNRPRLRLKLRRLMPESEPVDQTETASDEGAPPAAPPPLSNEPAIYEEVPWDETELQQERTIREAYERDRLKMAGISFTNKWSAETFWETIDYKVLNELFLLFSYLGMFLFWYIIVPPDSNIESTLQYLTFGANLSKFFFP